MDKTRSNVVISEKPGGGYEALARLAEAVFRTEEFSRIVQTLASQSVETWAGKSGIKKTLSRPVVRSIKKRFSVKGDAGSPVTELFADSEFLSSAVSGLPEMINSLLNVFESAVSGIADLSPEDRARVLAELPAGIDFTKAGHIVTGLASIVNRVHETDPLFFNETLRPKIIEIIESIDFGEIKEALDGSKDDFAAIIKTVNEEMWRYPAKFVLLLSLIPLLVNFILSAVKETLEPMNRLAPDLLTDVVISLLKDVDTGAAGSVINELCEIIRKVHTGSALIGEPGKPAIPGVLNELTVGILNNLDIELFFKARDLFIELKDAGSASIMSAMEDNPEITKDLLRGYFRSNAASFRRWSHKSELFESFSDAELAAEFESGMGQIDAQEAAVTFSRVCAIFNRVHEQNPEIIRNTLAQAVSSMDSYETGEFTRWFTADIVESLKPLAPEIMPPVIRGVADLIKSGGESEEMKDAVNYLRTVLNGKEAAV